MLKRRDGGGGAAGGWVGGVLRFGPGFFSRLYGPSSGSGRPPSSVPPPPPKNTSKQITSEVSHGVIRDQSGVECKDLQNVIFISGNQSMDSEVWMKAAEPHAE